MKMIMAAFILFLPAAGAAWGAGPAEQGPRPLTLKEARSLAVKNHPLVRSAELGIEASKEEEAATASALFPQLNGMAVGAFANKNTVLAAQSSGLTNSSVTERGAFGLGASQLLTDFGKTATLVESSRLKTEAQRERTNLTRESVLLNVTRSYYDVLRAQKLLQVAQETLKARKTLLEQVSSLRDAQMRSDLDVSIARQIVDDANLLILKAKNGVDDTQASLSEALGLDGSYKWKLADEARLDPPPQAAEPLIDEALEKNPELSSLKAEQGAARKTAEAEAKSQYPVITALGVAGAAPFTDPGQPMEPSYGAIGLTVTVPFYTGGRIEAQQRQAQFKAEAVTRDLEAKRNVLDRDVRVAYNNARTAYDNIEVTGQFLKNATDAYGLTLARYEIGKSSIVDLNQAQLAKTEAEIANANAGYEYLIQRAILDYRVGGTAEKYSAP